MSNEPEKMPDSLDEKIEQTSLDAIPPVPTKENVATNMKVRTLADMNIKVPEQSDGPVTMPDGFDEKIEQISLDAIHLLPTKENVFTKAGGQPLASRSFEWPKWKGKSLAFLMQIKLSEMDLLSRMAHFPQNGLLYVFYDQEQSTWGYDPNDKGSWKIIFEPEHDDLVVVPYPEDIDHIYKYREKKLGQKLIKTYPSGSDERIDAFQFTHEQSNWYFDVFYDSAYQSKYHHQIGGYAYEVQCQAMDLECQLVSNGIFCGDANYLNDPRTKELEKHRSDWMLLLQIDSDDDVDFIWGDIGLLYFWIKKDDLEKLNFEDVWMILQCL